MKSKVLIGLAAFAVSLVAVRIAKKKGRKPSERELAKRLGETYHREADFIQQH